MSSGIRQDTLHNALGQHPGPLMVFLYDLYHLSNANIFSISSVHLLFKFLVIFQLSGFIALRHLIKSRLDRFSVFSIKKGAVEDASTTPKVTFILRSVMETYQIT